MGLGRTSGGSTKGFVDWRLEGPVDPAGYRRAVRALARDADAVVEDLRLRKGQRALNVTATRSQPTRPSWSATTPRPGHASRASP